MSVNSNTLLLILATAISPILSHAALAAAADTDLQEITVTGIRASITSAQEAKKDAPSVIESITMEDLGKFTDKSIADALQRVPGVNIQRTAGTFDTGYTVTIRGLAGGFRKPLQQHRLANRRRCAQLKTNHLPDNRQVEMSFVTSGTEHRIYFQNHAAPARSQKS